jgi:hypothetical protein
MTSPRVLFLSRGFLAMRPVRAEEALPMPATIRTRGQVLLGLKPIAAPDPAQRQKHQADGLAQGISDPLLPIAGIRTHARPPGKANRVFWPTAGSATDPAHAGLRRPVVDPARSGSALALPAGTALRSIGNCAPSLDPSNGAPRRPTPAGHGRGQVLRAAVFVPAPDVSARAKNP